MNKNRIAFIAATLVVALTLRADPEKSDYSGDVKVKTLLRTSTNADGQTIVYPKNGPAEASILTVEIPPGKQTGWHQHPVPIFGYLVSGTLTVYFADGKKHTFHAGDTLAEAVDVVHNGINEGNDTVKLLLFVAGERNVPFTVKEPNPGEMAKSPVAPKSAPTETKP